MKFKRSYIIPIIVFVLLCCIVALSVYLSKNIFIIDNIFDEIPTNAFLYGVIGMVFYIIFSLLDYNKFRRFLFIFVLTILQVIFIVLAAMFSNPINGARRFLALGPFSINPWDFLPIVIILVFAYIFDTDFRKLFSVFKEYKLDKGIEIEKSLPIIKKIVMFWFGVGLAILGIFNSGILVKLLSRPSSLPVPNSFEWLPVSLAFTEGKLKFIWLEHGIEFVVLVLITYVLLTLLIIFVFLSIKSKYGRLVITFLSILFAYNVLVHTLSNLELIPNHLTAPLPFYSYGLSINLPFFIAMGIITSAYIRRHK